jgi:tRNA dimethylallyltransferase
MNGPEKSCDDKLFRSAALRDGELDAGAYFLVGPTAVGKSAVAQWIAETLGWPVLSADSMLVYKGMDVGTAKPSPSDRAKVHYYGIDLVSPDTDFSVWAYRSYACELLLEQAGPKIPMKSFVVAGGTGLYVKSLTHGLDFVPRADPAVREHWNAVLKEQGVGPLQDALRMKSPALFQSLDDIQNGRRLVRALELVEHGDRVPCRTWKEDSHARLVGLSMSKNELKSRIASRIAGMYSNGLLSEVEKLLENYSALSDTARQAIGYAEAIECIRGRCSEDEAVAGTVRRTKQLAKRQGTWFRHQADVKWIHIDDSMKLCEIGKMVIDEWRKHGPTRIFQ